MTYRQLFELVPEDKMDTKIVLFDPWNGNVWTGATAEIASDDIEDPLAFEDEAQILVRSGDPVLIIP